jgi:hypothetical protein
MELMVIMPRDIEPSCLFTTSCILSVKINAGNLFFGGVFLVTLLQKVVAPT